MPEVVSLRQLVPKGCNYLSVYTHWGGKHIQTDRWWSCPSSKCALWDWLRCLHPHCPTVFHFALYALPNQPKRLFGIDDEHSVKCVVYRLSFACDRWALSVSGVNLWGPSWSWCCRNVYHHFYTTSDSIDFAIAWWWMIFFIVLIHTAIFGGLLLWHSL